MDEEHNHNTHVLSQRTTTILYNTAEYFLNNRTIFRSDTDARKELFYLDFTLILQLIIPQTVIFGVVRLGY